MSSLSPRLLLGVLLVLSACTSDAPAESASTGAADTTSAAPAGASGTMAERAAAAGISDEDVAYLDSTQVPVYLPTLPEGWRLEEVFTERDNENDTFVHFYSATYRTPDSTCVSISGKEGPADPWASAPPSERAVAVPGAPTSRPVRLGVGTTGDAAGDWGNGLITTEGFGENGHTYVVGTSDEDTEGHVCRAASREDVETVLTSLRALDPALDARTN